MPQLKSLLVLASYGGYLVLGAVQLLAIFDFFSEYCGWWFLFAAPAALVFAYTPVVGGIMGTIAAYSVWGWNLLGAAALFFWPIFFYGIGLIITATVSVATLATVEKKVKAS